jgi:hypothetical protein
LAVKTTAQPSALHPPGSQPSLYRPGIITLLPDEPIETTHLEAAEGKADAQARLALRYSIGAGLTMDAAKAAE